MTIFPPTVTFHHPDAIDDRIDGCRVNTTRIGNAPLYPLVRDVLDPRRGASNPQPFCLLVWNNVKVIFLDK